MARNVYFSFHYQRDILRVQVVRNSWVCYPTNRDAGYFDRGLWEEAKTKGSPAIRKLIEEGMTQTSVTVVLIGAETANRTWVDYEIRRSIELGKGLLGIRINNVPSMSGGTDYAGNNPFTQYGPYSVNPVRTTHDAPIYDWVNDNGFSNLGIWVEAAALRANR